MRIVIKEINGFMPDTIISILEQAIQVEENGKIKLLSYNQLEIREIMKMFLEICRNWKDKYIDKGIILNEYFIY